MEGLPLRVKSQDMLRKGTKPRNKSEQMILNNYNTIQHIAKNRNGINAGTIADHSPTDDAKHARQL